MGKILFVSDAHSQTGRRGADSRFALRQSLRLAKKNEVDYLFFVGDNADRQKNRSSPIIDLLNVVRDAKLSDQDIDTLFIQGQHDMDDPPWLASSGAKHMHKSSIELDGKLIYGLDFLPAERLQEELKEIPKDAYMLVCHQVWSEWMGDIASPQGSFADIPHVKQVVTGDLHQTCIETHRNKQGHKMKVVSCGATYQKAINEPSEHCVMLWDSANGSFEQLPLKSRKFIDWTPLLSQEDLEEFIGQIGPKIKQTIEECDKYPEDVRKPLLRVTYSHKLENVRRRIRKTIGDSALLYEKEIPPEEKLKKSKVTGGKQAAVTPLTELPKIVDKAEEPEVFNLLTRLLQAPDKDRQTQELERFQAEFLQAE